MDIHRSGSYRPSRSYVKREGQYVPVQLGYVKTPQGWQAFYADVHSDLTFLLASQGPVLSGPTVTPTNTALTTYRGRTCYPFDGSGYVDVNPLPFAVDDAPWTVMTWYYPTSFIDYTHVLTANPQSAFGFKLNITTGVPYLVYANASYYSNGAAPTVGVWNHITYTYAAGQLTIYLNGIAVDSLATPPIDVTPLAYSIGRRADDTVVSPEYSHGYQSDTRIYQRCLDADAVGVIHHQTQLDPLRF